MEPLGEDSCIFTATINLRVGPLYKKFGKRHLDSINQHMKEEWENEVCGHCLRAEVSANKRRVACRAPEMRPSGSGGESSTWFRYDCKASPCFVPDPEGSDEGARVIESGVDLGLKELASLLGRSVGTLGAKARLGKLPGVYRDGGRWKMSRENAEKLRNGGSNG